MKNTSLGLVDYLSILLVVLKISGWLHWTWLQVLALPIFSFLVGFTEEALRIYKQHTAEEKTGDGR